MPLYYLKIFYNLEALVSSQNKCKETKNYNRRMNQEHSRLKNTSKKLKRKFRQSSKMCNALFRNCTIDSLSLANSRSLCSCNLQRRLYELFFFTVEWVLLIAWDLEGFE
jgi:hypothetical protein